jgi:hypothetical protein
VLAANVRLCAVAGIGTLKNAAKRNVKRSWSASSVATIVLAKIAIRLRRLPAIAYSPCWWLLPASGRLAQAATEMRQLSWSTSEVKMKCGRSRAGCGHQDLNFGFPMMAAAIATNVGVYDVQGSVGLAKAAGRQGPTWLMISLRQ